MKVSSIESEDGGGSLIGLWLGSVRMGSVRMVFGEISFRVATTACYRSLLPRRPAEWAAAEKVYVQMVYRLTSMITAIHDETISLFEMK